MDFETINPLQRVQIYGGLSDTALSKPITSEPRWLKRDVLFVFHLEINFCLTQEERSKVSVVKKGNRVIYLIKSPNYVRNTFSQSGNDFKYGAYNNSCLKGKAPPLPLLQWQMS